jgi:hypothetical protein
VGAEGAIGNLGTGLESEGSRNREPSLYLAIFDFRERAFVLVGRLISIGTRATPSSGAASSRDFLANPTFRSPTARSTAGRLRSGTISLRICSLFPYVSAAALEGCAGHVAAGMSETLDEPNFDRGAP